MLFPESILTVILFLFGASLASFTHTTEYRIRSQKKYRLRSFCEKCEATVPSYALLPFFGYFLTAFRCRKCNYKIPILYPALEAFSGLMAVAFYLKSGLVPELFFSILIFQTFLFIAIHDFFTHYILSYSIFLIIILQMLFLFYWKPYLLLDRIVAMAIGAGIFHFISFFYSSFRNRVGLGEGDATLFGVIGLCWGKNVFLPLLILSSFLGIMYGVALLKFRKEKTNQPLPFAPALIAGAYFHFFFPNWQSIFQRLF